MKALSILLSALFLQININAQSALENFNEQYNTLLQTYVKKGKVDYLGLIKEAKLSKVVALMQEAKVSELSKEEQLAFQINSYNLTVINAVVNAYPISSVQDVSGFFDRKKYLLNGKEQSLNDFEDSMLMQFGEARLHFVLVCGALDCPPLIDEAYKAYKLEQQLDTQTQLALNNPSFLRTNNDGFSFSRIFKWYKSDFEKQSGSVLGFINQYRNTKIQDSDKISYYIYDWKLNDQSTKAAAKTGSNNDFRYVVSSTIRKGGIELKIFNNLYTQQTGSVDELVDRSSFYTTTFSFLYGLNDYFNVGLNGRYRRVLNNRLPSSAFDVLASTGDGQFRQGLTAIGPQIRWAPVPKWENFSVQSFYTFSVGEELEGNGELPFIDWNGDTWVTQVFNDFSIGDNFSLFADLSFWLEDIGQGSNGAANRFSTPLTLISSYFPTPKWTLYVLGGYSPFWFQDEYEYFRQFGAGTKYQFTPNYEIELLYTDFSNTGLSNSGGQAATYNLGFRYNY